jgi:SAM-dependent methyltransferase
MSISPMKTSLMARFYRNMKDRVNEITLSVFRSTSQRYLDSKINGFKQPDIFKNEDMAEHFAHQYLPEIASQNVVQGYIISRIEFIENALGKEQISHDTFIDIGDSDGIFIKSLGKCEISANISEIAVKNIYQKGISAIRCDVEHLPLKDGSVDHILFFQIFEHLPNPVSSLQELNRVAAKSTILSIPYVSKTNIHRYNYNPSWPIFEHHIFEFDDEDFRNVVSHAGFDVYYQETVTVLSPVTLKERCVFFLWKCIGIFRTDPEYLTIHNDLFAGCFKKFIIYNLIKKIPIS